MRGRGLMLVAGMKMGQQKAEQQAQAQSQQQAAVEQAKQQGSTEAVQQQDTTTSSRPASGMDDAAISQLQKLAELHNSGILSDDEFAAAKKKVLGM